MEDARAVQVRYNSGPVLCRVEKDGEGWVAHLEEPVMGVAAGQSAVFYTGDGERVVAGGVGGRGSAGARIWRTPAWAFRPGSPPSSTRGTGSGLWPAGSSGAGRRSRVCGRRCASYNAGSRVVSTEV